MRSGGTFPRTEARIPSLYFHPTATIVHSCLSWSSSSRRSILIVLVSISFQNGAVSRREGPLPVSISSMCGGLASSGEQGPAPVFLCLFSSALHLLLCFPFETPTPTSTTFIICKQYFGRPRYPAPLSPALPRTSTSRPCIIARDGRRTSTRRKHPPRWVYTRRISLLRVLVHAHQHGRARERVPVHCARARPDSAPSALHLLSRAGSESLVSTSNFRVRGLRPRALFLFYFLLCTLASEWVSTRS
ncbi:hypothetical protein C8R44DRAFT_991619, partial [Mycena epipterygia]